MKNLDKLKLTLISLCLTISSNSYSQDGNSDSAWDNFGFGIGLSYTFDTGNNDRVKSAEVVDGLVRVNDEENGIPRLVLEGHYFFGDDDDFAHGPFVAVQPGDDEIINSAAIGWMIGLRKKGTKTNSWNLGIGIAADPNVQILGDGIDANKALPGNEDSIRYKEKTQYGVMILFSTTW
jgi:hypothetical protein